MILSILQVCWEWYRTMIIIDNGWGHHSITRHSMGTQLLYAKLHPKPTPGNRMLRSSPVDTRAKFSTVPCVLTALFWPVRGKPMWCCCRVPTFRHLETVCLLSDNFSLQNCHCPVVNLCSKIHQNLGTCQSPPTTLCSTSCGWSGVGPVVAGQNEGIGCLAPPQTAQGPFDQVYQYHNIWAVWCYV